MKLVYAGSFDPLTLGHVDIINRSMKLCDELIILIAENYEKNYMISAEERKSLIEEHIKNNSLYDGYNIKVDITYGMLFNYFIKNDISASVRGVRNYKDFDYEIGMDNINRGLYDQFETIILPSNPLYSNISSSLVKEIYKHNNSAEEYVPEIVNNYLKYTKKLDSDAKLAMSKAREDIMEFRNKLLKEGK